MARMLGPAEYGVLGSLFAIMYIIQFSSPAINKTISMYTSKFAGKKRKKEITHLISKALFKILLFGFAFLIIYTLITPLIASFLNLDSIIGLIIIGFIGLLTMLNSVIIGGVNGLQKFGWQNFITIINTFLKLGLAIFLVYYGFGVEGAVTGLLFAALICLLLGFISLKNFIKIKTIKKFKSKKIYNYLFFAFLASTIPSLIITVDQLLVKHLFPSTESGYYAAASMIGRIIWFGSGFLVNILFPKVSTLKAKKKSVKKLLTKCLKYTGFMALIGCLTLLFAPNLIVNSLYGQEYASISSSVLFFGLSMGLFSLSQILISYNLALRKFKFLWIISLLLILEIISIFVFGTNIKQIIKIVLFINSLMFIGLLVFNRKDIINQKN